MKLGTILADNPVGCTKNSNGFDQFLTVKGQSQFKGTTSIAADQTETVGGADLMKQPIIVV